MHGVALEHLEPGSDEWVARRRSLLGASDLAAALGFSPHRSAYSLWAEKTGRLGGPEENRFMRMGKLLEPIILDEFQTITGLIVDDTEETYVHPGVPWASATPDGLTFESLVDPDDGSPIGMVEAKTDFGLWHNRDEEPGPEHVPEHIHLQVAWQQYVLGIGTAWVVLLGVGVRDFAVYELPRDEHLIAVARTAAEDFWRMVEDDVEPPVDAHKATSRALNERWESQDRVMELSTEAADALTGLRQLRKRLKRLGDEKARLENLVKAELEDAAVGTIAGAEAVTWKTSTRRGYTVEPGTSRRFLVKGGS